MFDQEPHRQWAIRPDDQRYEILTDLKAAVVGRRARAREVNLELQDLTFAVRNEGLTVGAGHDITIPTHWGNGGITVGTGHDITIPTHWGFGQLCPILGAPAGYLRTLPPHLVITLLEYGRDTAGHRTQKFLLDTENDGSLTRLRATTSTSFGRIYDAEVVEMVEQIVERTAGRFFNPKEWSGKPSGLYASDRDVFLFLIDGGSLVDGGGERDQLYRGFYTWNSEVGAAVFGFATFLFRVVCGNHLIWDVQDTKEIHLRHNAGAPGRFGRDVLPALLQHVSSSAKPLEDQIRRAKAFQMPAKRDKAIEWLRDKGFSKAVSDAALVLAEETEGGWGNLWQVIQGLTAHSRTFAFIDSRVDLDRRAGKLMNLVA